MNWQKVTPFSTKRFIQNNGEMKKRHAKGSWHAFFYFAIHRHRKYNSLLLKYFYIFFHFFTYIGILLLLSGGCFEAKAIAGNSCRFSELPNATYEQQLKWDIFAKEINEQIRNNLDTVWKLSNNTINEEQAAKEEVLTAISVASNVAGLMGLSRQNSLIELFTTSTNKSSDLLFTLVDDGSVSAEIRGIWRNAIFTAIETMEGDPSALFTFVLQEMIRQGVNLISLQQAIKLTKTINLYSSAADILNNYYACGSDSAQLSTTLGYDLYSCGNTEQCFNDYVSQRYNDIQNECSFDIWNPISSINTCLSAVDIAEVLAVANAYKDEIDRQFIIISQATSGRLSGAINDINGPVFNAKIDLYGPHLGIWDTKYTDSNGKYIFDGLAQASYYIIVSKSGYNPVTSNIVQVYRGVTTTIPTISLTPTATAPTTGTLTISTTPVNGVIYVDGQNKGTGYWSGSLPSGTYSVTYGNVSGYNAPLAQTAIVSGGQTTAITGIYTNLSDPLISGYVLTSDGSPISGVTMVFENSGSATTDGNGFYSKTVNSGWSGTVTPQKDYYAFNQPKAYYNVTSNQTNQNYTGTYTTPAITLISPNGNEDWQQETSHNITWNSQGNIGSSVKIELLKNGISNTVITSSTQNDGSYSWSVPDELVAGSDYKIRITSTANTAYTDESNGNFSISAGLSDFKSYWYWDFDTDGSEGWTGRNSTDEGVYASDYWIVNPDPDTASKSGIISPDGLTAINTNKYNALEVRAGVKNEYVPSLQAYFKINGQWYGPKTLNYISGVQQANMQVIYKGTIDYAGQIQQVRVDFVWGDNSADDRVYIDYVRFIDWSDNTSPTVTIGAPYDGESIVVDAPTTINFYAYDNILVDHIDVLYRSDGGGTFTSVAGCTGLPGTAQTCTWTPDTATNTAAIKVKAYDAVGNYGESITSFKIISPLSCTTYPPTPYLSTSGIYTSENRIELSWQSVSSATAYVLEESTTPTFTNPTQYLYPGTNNTNAILTNKANGTYYYHVKARNDCGDSWWSAWFATEVRVNAAPNVPNNPTPANSATGVSRTPTLRWNGGDSDGNADYYLEIGTLPGDMWPYQGYGSANSYNTSFVVPFTLEPATTYFWRVKSRDDQGFITEGPVWSFTTAYEYPDLVVSAFTVSGTIKNNSVVTANVTIQNEGNYVAAGASIRFFYSTIQNGEDNEFIYDSVNLTALEPGQSTIITKQLTLKNIVAGTSYLVAKADTAGYFTENNIGNNKLSYTINYTDNTGPDISYFDFRGSTNGTFRTNQAVQFVYSVFDDIGVSGIDLYYSTDDSTTWNSVATNLPITNEGYGNYYNWVVPENTPLNSTFKIRIVARDTSGNSSQRVLGPFTIIDGSKPTVTITSPVANDIWELGSSHDVQWNVSSASGVQQIELYYLPIYERIAVFNYTDPGTYTWTLPTSGSAASTNGRIEIRVTGNNGMETVAYSDFFTVIDESTPPPAPWHTQEGITTAPTLTEPYIYQQDAPGVIAVDNENNVHLMYLYIEDDVSGVVNNTGPRIIKQEIRYKKLNGATWTDPQTVYSVTENYDSYHQIGGLRVALDSLNKPHFVWLNSLDHQSCESYNSDEIFYAYYNGSVWSSPINVSNNSTWSRTPNIKIDNNDDVHITWPDGWTRNSNCSSSGNQSIYHRVRHSNGTWSAAEAIVSSAPYNSNNVMAKDSNGNINVVFTASSGGLNTAYHATWNGDVWTAPTVVSEVGEVYYSSLANGSNGTLHLAYVEVGEFDTPGTERFRMVYQYYDGTLWGNQEILLDVPNRSGAMHTPGSLAIAANSQNAPQLLWRESNPDGPKILYRQKTSCGWSNAIPVHTAATHPDSTGLSSAISATDILHVIWYAYSDNVLEIYHNYADVSADFISPTVAVTAPSSNEVLTAGTIYDISWTASDNVNIAYVELKYSLDGGTTYTTIANTLPNNGYYSWTVPNISSDTVQIVVTAYDPAGNMTLANSEIFRIEDNSGPSITITSPSGGELWGSGTLHDITWSAADINGVSSINIFGSSGFVVHKLARFRFLDK